MKNEVKQDKLERTFCGFYRDIGGEGHDYCVQKEKFQTLEQAAEDLKKYLPGWREKQIYLAKLPFTPTKEECRWVSNPKYLLLTCTGETGRYAGETRPLYLVESIPNENELVRKIEKFVAQNGEEAVHGVIAGISFNLEGLIKQMSKSKSKIATRKLLTEFGLEERK